MSLHLSEIQLFNKELVSLPDTKLLINTLNAHCFNMAQKDISYANALCSSDVLLPDGISIVWAVRFLYGKRLKKIAGDDLFKYEMDRLNNGGGKCFFLGSSPETLKLITSRAGIEYPNVRVESYSPPYVTEFSENEIEKMVTAVNMFEPDVLFVGMTAPKQEKWAFGHFEKLNAGHICSIGAVFDFYAGTVKRAPEWMIKIGLEWFYRLLKEPRRMWRRYILGNVIFLFYILKERQLIPIVFIF